MLPINTLGCGLALLFTPGQLMSALSLSKQQWRTYRQALPQLTPEAGRSACFTAGDILAAAVVQSAATAMHAPISVFSPLAGALFDLCRAYPWPRLERAHLVLAPTDGQVVLVDSEQRLGAAAVSLIVPLAPLVADLRERLMAGGSDPQHDLSFPPMFAGGRP